MVKRSGYGTRAATRGGADGFVVTLEVLLILTLVVMPLVIGGVLVGRKALTAYRASRDYLEQPYAQAYIVDSSPGPLPRLLGRVIGYDPYEAPLVVFRDRATHGGVVLGVRPRRLTSFGEVFYTNDTCDPSRETDEFGQPTGFPKIRAWNASTGTGDTAPAYIYPPDGFLYQNLHTSYAMGNFNILYRSADTASAAVTPASGLPGRVWAALARTIEQASPWLSGVSRLAAHLATLAERTVAAQSYVDYLVYTGQAGAQTQIDLKHSSNWYLTVTPGNTLTFSGGLFTMKGGCPTCPAVVLTLRQGGPGGAVLATGSQPNSAFTSQFKQVAVTFSAIPTLSAGTYYLSLTSTTSDAGSTQYFIKQPDAAYMSSDGGVTVASASVLSVAATPSATPNLTVNKLATETAQTSGAIHYRIGLGNDGGATSGTTATILDQLPAGVVATAVDLSAGAAANVTGVTCVPALPSSAGASLKCTVTLAAGIPQATASGWAYFTLVATAPATAGTLTNYVSVDATGGSSPPDPPSASAACAVSNCAQATTVVTSQQLPANLTLNKIATSTVTVGGTITYTLGLGNNGGVTSGTSATVADQLPAGVVATAVAAGTGVSAVNCGSLPSAPGALLTCTLTLTSGLGAGASAGTARFTITATAPDMSATATNYASVDATGSSAPPTPGAACSTTSCAQASTNVTALTPFYVWRSQDIAPPTPLLPAPSPPCYPVVTPVDNLVSAAPVIDFDAASNYTLPFRAVFERPTAAPPNPCPGEECP